MGCLTWRMRFDLPLVLRDTASDGPQRHSAGVSARRGLAFEGLREDCGPAAPLAGRTRCRSALPRARHPSPRGQTIHPEGSASVSDLRGEPGVVFPDDDARPDARPAGLPDLVALCQSLNREAARYVVIGGMAVIQAGFVRATEDIDLLVDNSPDNVARIRCPHRAAGRGDPRHGRRRPRSVRGRPRRG